jgi:hypothetical protein
MYMVVLNNLIRAMCSSKADAEEIKARFDDPAARVQDLFPGQPAFFKFDTGDEVSAMSTDEAYTKVAVGAILISVRQPFPGELQ